jgi:hypothetical protein
VNRNLLHPSVFCDLLCARKRCSTAGMGRINNSAEGTMNLQSFVVVLLRLVSLNFLLQVVVQLILQASRVSTAYQHLPADEFRSALVMPLLVILALVIGGGLLWILATPIARVVTRGLPIELSFGTLSLSDCYSLVFIGLGLFYAANNFPGVLNWSHYLLKLEASRPDDSWRQQLNWYEVSQTFLLFIVGIILFVNGRKWAVALAGKQTRSAADSPPPNPEQPTTPP